MAKAYAGTFLTMLPGRIQRIITSLRAGDNPAAMDAVLSLKVSSHMVGGLTVEQACRRLERRLRNGDIPAPALAAEVLTGHCRTLAEALADYLSEVPNMGTPWVTPMAEAAGGRQRDAPAAPTRSPHSASHSIPSPQACGATKNNSGSGTIS